MSVKIEIQMLRYLGIPREVIITTLTVHLLCKILELFFLAALLLGRDKKETVFQPLNTMRSSVIIDN